MASKKYDPLYNDYVTAKKRAWENTGIRLTEGDFLRTIDPSTKWTDARASYYMSQLKSGKWSSTNVHRRSQQSAGHMYRILFRNKRGEVVNSAAVRVPGGYSLHEAYMSGTLQEASQHYRERTSPPHERDEDAEEDDEMIPTGAIYSFKPPKHRKVEMIMSPTMRARRIPSRG